MKSSSYLFITLFLLSIMFVSCAPQEQNALIKENQEQATDTNVNAAFLEKQETEAETITKHKIIITPLEYVSTNSKYPNPEVYKTIFFSSFYNLFSVLPAIDLPDKSVLLTMSPSEGTISNLADQYKCDFIVFGDYSLKGGKDNPEAAINLKIWNKLSGSIITNSITTPTDTDLFDSIDFLMGKMVKTMLNEEMKIANLNFGNFDTGKEPLGIFINHKLIAEPISNDFHLNMKILSGKDYKVAIRRMFDGKLLTNTIANLKPGESINLSATNYRINLCNDGEFKGSKEILYAYFNSDSDILKLSEPENLGEWHLRLQYGAKGWANINDGECHIIISNTGSKSLFYSVALVIIPVKIVSGKNYRFSFDARTVNSHKIFFKIGRLSDYFNYLNTSTTFMPCSINKEMKSYTFLFKMFNETDEKAYLEIAFADSTGDVWIKNVRVEEVD